MSLEEEMLELLNSNELNTNYEQENSDMKQLNDAIMAVYGMINPNSRFEFVQEAGAFALAKGMERKILSQIRPGQVRIWLVILEIHEGAKFNLPPFIEDKIYDYMDAAENAISEYIMSNLTFDFRTLLVKLQNMGEYLAEKHDLKSLKAGGLGADKVMTRDEFHNFCCQGGVKTLEEQGYEIVKVNQGSANPVSIIATKDGILYTIALVCAMLPASGELKGWRLQEFEKIPQDETHKSAILGVSIISANELYASMGICVKEGEYNFKVSSLNVIGPNGLKDKQERL